MKLSQVLESLDILGARPSRDYVGSTSDNPAMKLEEKVPVFTRLTDMEDLQDCMRIFQEKVCIPGFPARFSPQFWLAHAALSTIYQVLCSFIQMNFDPDVKQQTDHLLFHLWVDLISAGPGSAHFEMMDIIMKNQHFPLWKYMETIKGEKLQLLIATLKTDFVYVEEVSADHYATLMETHIDKIFRSILSNEQFEEGRRELLDLHLYYLGRMNHVPPHIGPRLSHLCFLIFNKYPMENPYIGTDDWVLTRNHLRIIKEVITHKSFTVGCEAQYRVPITLEKIMEAAVSDNMLEILFKDFMTLLLTLCNYGNCRKCKRLFVAYQNGLFEQLDFKKGFEKRPDWLFDQCVGALVQVVNVNALELHMDTFIISTEHMCLLQFTKLSVGQVAQWHKLLVNHLVSGRALLVKEVCRLLSSPVLKEEDMFNWKTHVDTGRMLVDIISDLPWTFIQDNEDSNLTDTVQQYSDLLQQLLDQFRDQEVTGRYTASVNRCVLKCTDQAKSAITLVCLKSEICDFKDMNFIREVLFSMDTLLKELDFSTCSSFLTEAVLIMLTSSLEVFREKGYIAVDYNSLLMSICVTCASAANDPQTEDQTSGEACMSVQLYISVVKEFVNLHSDKGTLLSVAPLVPKLILVIQECTQQGTDCGNCVDLLQLLGTRSMKLLTDHSASLLELLLDWGVFDIQALLLRIFSQSPLEFVQHFQTMFDKLSDFDVTDRHLIVEFLSAMSVDHAQLFTHSHVSQLLNMYPSESHLTQNHILDILTNVASKVPALLTASHYSMLMDSTKFSPLSLKLRAPILSQMSQQTEDYKRQVIEHLMQYIGHKDSAVGLVAMETLIPLLKDNPTYVQKQKMKFRNLWKSTTCADVKKLCAELIPDLKYSGKKPEVKETPSKNVKPVITPAKTKFTVQVRPSTQGRQSSVSLTRSSKPAAPSLRASTYKPTITSSKLNHDTGDARQSTADHSKPNLPAVDNNYGDVSVNKDHQKADVTMKTYVGIKNLSGKECAEDTVQSKSDSKDVNQVDKPVLGDISLLETGNAAEEIVAEATQRNSSSGSYDSGTNLAQRPKTDSNKENEKLTHDSTAVHVEWVPEVTDKSETTDKPAVCLKALGSVNIESLSVALKDAGYDNYTDTHSQTGDGAYTDSLKVLICCIADKTHSEKLINDLKQIDNDIVVIILRMKPLFLPHSGTTMKVLHEKCCIRFYQKPGENTVKGENWPRHKFCELLMQLNYHGILQNDQLVTHEFKNLWQLSEKTVPGNLKNTKHVTMKTATPDVFISYHWGKQVQVEPLYDYLSSLNIPCWMSVYHMSGSESLYNQIVHGVHSCRVMIACVTSNYTKAAYCRQEITIANKLNKPIIPLVLGETKWPPYEGEIGASLGKFLPLRMNLTQEKLIDMSAIAVKKLMQQLAVHIQQACDNTQTTETTLESEKCSQNLDIKTSERTTMEKEIITSDEEKKNAVFSQENKTDTMLTSKRYAKRSASLFEIKKGPPHYTDLSNDSGLGIDEKTLPRGVTIDGMGYTVRSARSKSCVIL